MDCDETLTATGTGRWGDHTVRFALSRVRRTWHARHSDEVRSWDQARLTFQIEGMDVDMRTFDSEALRDEFVAQSISDRVDLEPSDVTLLGCRNDWGADLVGERLVGVRFVLDYLQLQFDGGISNLYVWPEIHLVGSVLRFGDATYRDALCAFIADEVKATDIFTDDGAVIVFGSGELVISPEAIRTHDQPEVFYGFGGFIEAGGLPFD